MQNAQCACDHHPLAPRIRTLGLGRWTSWTRVRRVSEANGMMTARLWTFVTCMPASSHEFHIFRERAWLTALAGA